MARSTLATVAWILVAACVSDPPERVAPVAESTPAEEEAVAPPESRFLEATVALEHGRFEEAYWEFQALAEQCESGKWGRRSVLLLAAQVMDPGNPLRFPDAGAQLAARYLQVPAPSISTEALARSLYVHALELGATPVEDPFAPIPIRDTPPEDAGGRSGTAREAAIRAEAAGSWTVAPRFRSCDSRETPSLVRSLPDAPESTLYGDLEALSREREFLRARVDSLESELERVRGLLRSGATRADTAPGLP